MGNPSKPVPPFSGYGAQLNGSITTDSNNSKTTSDNSEHPGSSADVNFNSAESVAISNDVVIHMEEEEDVQEVPFTESEPAKFGKKSKRKVSEKSSQVEKKKKKKSSSKEGSEE